MAAPDLGTASTITFAVAGGFSANLLSVSWSGITRPAIKTSHMLTTTADTFIVGDLYDPGEIQASFQFDGLSTTRPPIDGAVGLITIDVAGAGVNNKWTAQGFITDTGWDAPLEDLMVVNVTIKCTGAIAII